MEHRDVISVGFDEKSGDSSLTPRVTSTMPDITPRKIWGFKPKTSKNFSSGKPNNSKILRSKSTCVKQ